MTQPNAPVGSGDSAGAGVPQGLPSAEQMDLHYAEENAGSGGQQEEPTPAPGATAPDDDPDGDQGFESQFKDFRMPDGVKKRISSLTEARNKARAEAKAKAETEEKEYGFFKPYANDQGRQYLQTLVQFDSLLEKAFEGNPWLADLVKSVVVEGNGSPADKRKVMALLGEAKAEAAEEEATGTQGSNTPPELKELLEWKQSVEQRQRQSATEAKHRTAVDQFKENYRAEIADFQAKNPQFKDDKSFTRLALQVSAARNITFTEAAKEMAEYVGSREKAGLTKLAKAGADRDGAGVEQPGRGGVPAKSRPAFGSDEEAAEMDAYYGGQGR